MSESGTLLTVSVTGLGASVIRGTADHPFTLRPRSRMLVSR